ncbi:hypothetical protein PHLCEN_2v13293 [Hermanssonia centrifuga]|uniref:Uncharacterized protein n=1 Tax=Hermanssonia centrifuga TaxID=98765 RepID=A0A2R6NFS0_9APHY|nr:hypothetical protein PHLCEN_2v13293 [Hermanssonia centrifuga]
MANFHVPTLINVAANMGDSLAYHGEYEEYVEEDFSDDGTDLSSEISTITDICGPCDVYLHNVEVYKRYGELSHSHEPSEVGTNLGGLKSMELAENNS